MAAKKEEIENYDFVNKPTHYNGHTLLAETNHGKEIVVYETIDLIESELNRRKEVLNPDEIHSFGDAIKYVDRMGEKPEEGKTVRQKMAEDALKTAWYFTRMAELIKKNGY